MASTISAKVLKKLVSMASERKTNAPKKVKRSRRGRSRRQAKRENAMLDMAAAPAAFAGGWIRKEPKSKVPQRGGLFRIEHSEFVTSIAGATSFTASSLSINPGLVSMFPWLSRIANNFESYIFHSLWFEFVTKKASSTAGDVMMAVDFDAADGTPASEQDLTSYKGYATNSVWRNFCTKYFSAAELQKSKQYYVRAAAVADTDIKTYDVGNFIYAVDACADTTSVGRIIVHYDIELITPQMQNPLQNPISQRIDASGSPGNASSFGTSPVSEGNVLATAATSTLTFAQPGEYSVVLYAAGTGIQNPTISASTAATSGVVRSAIVSNTSLVILYKVITSTVNQTLVLAEVCSGAGSISALSVYISLFENNNWTLTEDLDLKSMERETRCLLSRLRELLSRSELEMDDEEEEDFRSVRSLRRSR
jgi:hypothetical protein